MTTDGGGWTLVGQEQAGVGETLALLGVEQGSPSDLLGSGSALIGARFVGLYTEVRVVWDGSRYVQMTPNAEVFDDTVDKSIALSSFETSEATLQGWVDSSGGAKLCRAATTASRPGDTSWAVKPDNDNSTSCGCNGGGWSGRGAFYTGLEDCDSCGCWGPGSFVGVKDNSVQKAGLTAYRTQIWIR
jgi:hypothetical protein